jgi:hypothetical protein
MAVAKTEFVAFKKATKCRLRHNVERGGVLAYALALLEELPAMHSSRAPYIGVGALSSRPSPRYIKGLGLFGPRRR